MWLFFVTNWPRLSVFCCTLSKTKHCTQPPIFCLSCHAHSFYVPYPLLFSTLSPHSLPPSIPSSHPFSLWQTASCPFLCLLCLWSLIRKINKKTPIGWKDRGLSSEWIKNSHWEDPQCNKSIWIWGSNGIIIDKCFVCIHMHVSEIAIKMTSLGEGFSFVCLYTCFGCTACSFLSFAPLWYANEKLYYSYILQFVNHLWGLFNVA